MSSAQPIDSCWRSQGAAGARAWRHPHDLSRTCARRRGRAYALVMALLARFRNWLRGSEPEPDHGQRLAESSVIGGVAAVTGPSRHRAESVVPDDDLGATGGPPSHDDPLEPRLR